MKALLFLTIIFFNFHTFAANKIINSQIDFVAKGNPSFIKATGELKIEEAKLMLKENMLNGDIIVDLTKLDSGIELRDSHLKEKYLHTKKFPHAVLKIKNINFVNHFNGKFKAQLSFHGVEKEIDVIAEIKKEKNKLTFEGNFDLKLTDFSVELPSFQGITAADVVKIKVQTNIEI